MSDMATFDKLINNISDKLNKQGTNFTENINNIKEHAEKLEKQRTSLMGELENVRKTKESLKIELDNNKKLITENKGSNEKERAKTKEISKKLYDNLEKGNKITTQINNITSEIAKITKLIDEQLKEQPDDEKLPTKKGGMFRGGRRKLNRWRYISHNELFGGYSKDTLVRKARKWGIANPTKYKTRQELQTVMKVLMHCKYGDVGKRYDLNLIAKNININPKNYKKKHNLHNAICNKTKNISFNLRGGRKNKK